MQVHRKRNFRVSHPDTQGYQIHARQVYPTLPVKSSTETSSLKISSSWRTAKLSNSQISASAANSIRPRKRLWLPWALLIFSHQKSSKIRYRITSKPYSFKTDVWSIGVLVYLLCTSKYPFDADSLHFLVLKIVRGKYDPLPSPFSKDLKSLVSSMLQINSQKRISI